MTEYTSAKGTEEDCCAQDYVVSLTKEWMVESMVPVVVFVTGAVMSFFTCSPVSDGRDGATPGMATRRRSVEKPPHDGLPAATPQGRSLAHVPAVESGGRGAVCLASACTLSQRGIKARAASAICP